MKKFLLLFLIPILFAGCKKTDQGAIDDGIIKKYIADHNLTATAEPNGLYYVPIIVGSGPYPTINSTVTVTYKGYTTDGTVFDQRTTSFALSQVIAGWQEGIPLMQAGGKCTLLIPSALGYGAASAGSIPPNSVLIFDIQLISFQ